MKQVNLLYMALQLYNLVLRSKVLHLILLKCGEELGNDMNSTILIYLFVFPFRLKKISTCPISSKFECDFYG